MKLITRDTDYAVRAICFILQGKKKVMPVDDLIKALKMPRPFLRKILQLLNKNRILHSYKGQGGGFMLAMPADKIYLVDLMEIFQGALKLNECLFKKRLCPNIYVCKLRKRICGIEKKLLLELKSITISSLME